MAQAAIELIGINKSFGAVQANRDINLVDRARHDPRHRRRERRRQVDADVDPLRLLPGRLRRDPGRRQAGRDQRRRTTRSRSASAWCTSISCWSRISPCSRTSCSAPRARRCSTAGIAKARSELERLEREYGLDVDPDAIIEELPVGLQQRVEILKALYRGADILILDEPTGVLTPAEADHLFRILRQLKDAGQDDHPDHPQAARDHGDHRHGLGDAPGRDGGDARDRRHDGRGTGRTDGRPPRAAAGREGRAPARRGQARGAGPDGARTRAASPWSTTSPSTSAAGEIVGIAGVAGNGQSELLEAICRHPARRCPARSCSTASRSTSTGTPTPASCATAASPMCRRTATTSAWCSPSRRTRTPSSAITTSRYT